MRRYVMEAMRIWGGFSGALRASLDGLFPKGSPDAVAKEENKDARIFHVIVMRFGIGIFDELWLEHRFGLLAAITVPSLQQQDWSTGAKLLIQVDEEIDERWYERLKNLVSGLPATIQKLQLHGDRRPGLGKYCKENVPAGITHILTTRIDDDDAMSSGAIREIHDEAYRQLSEGCSACAIAIGSTLRYLAESGLAIQYIAKDPEGIGLSVLLPIGDTRNVYSWSHKKIRKLFEGPMVFLKNAQALYTIHRMSDSDYLTRKRLIDENWGRFQVDDELMRQFGIDLESLVRWRELDGRSPVLSIDKTTEYIGVIEKSIREEQRRLKGAKLSGSDELDRLLAERREMGGHITKSLVASAGGSREGAGHDILQDSLTSEGRLILLSRQKQYCESIVASAINQENAKEIRKAISHVLSDIFAELTVALGPRLVLEIGAHEAGYSAKIKSRLPGARVIAMEANPKVYDRFRNKLISVGIEYINVIVSGVDGQKTLRVPKRADGKERLSMGSILDDRKGKDFSEYVVESFRLDSLVRDFIDNVIWVDVEGACLEVLRGGNETLSKCLALYAEVEDSERWSGQALFSEVVARLGEFDIVPVLSDVQRERWQSNVLFVHRSLLSDERVISAYDRFFGKLSHISPSSIRINAG